MIEAYKADGRSAIPISSDLLQTMTDVSDGIHAGHLAKLTSEGCSGTYFLREKSSQIRAVFKPIDEEQFAPNNPRGFKGKFGDAGFRAGVLSGEATVREMAAYLIDHDGFAGVSQTCLVKVQAG